MHYALFVLMFLVLLTGCASDERDRAFFDTGWIRPEAGAERRLNAR
jgi:hypothetical protein